MDSNGLVVVVTGASGCTGQHIVHLLHTTDLLHIKELRLFDITPFRQGIKYDKNVSITETITVGDIRNQKTLKALVTGADAVIHTASVIDYTTSAKKRRMWEVNVAATQFLVNECIDAGVRYFVYTSSADVDENGVSLKTIQNNNYMTKDVYKMRTRTTKHSSEYGLTKVFAEYFVNQANGTKLKTREGNNDKSTKFQTVIVRPSCIYGDCDNHFVYVSMKFYVPLGMFIPAPSENGSTCEMQYAGNVAWTHLCALKKLTESSNKVAGKAYYVDDDTPKENINVFLTTVMRARGLRISPIGCPVWLALFITWLLEIIAWILSPIVTISLVYSIYSIRRTSWSPVFKTAKEVETMKIDLEYKPYYSYEESLSRSIKYYNELEIS